MADIFQAIILGVIQGISEFLPISSSGHLVIFPWLFNFKDPGLSFDVALHFGTLLAVVTYFYRDWIIIMKLSALNLKHKENKEIFSDSRYMNNTLWILAAATIPGVLAGLFLEDLAATIFRHPLLVAFNLFFWGAVLYWADQKTNSQKNVTEKSNGRHLKDIKFRDGIFIGLAQALAIVPGTSRSGITITAGLFRQLDRVSAARFSFLLLTPIVLGASILKIKDLVFNFNVPMLAGIFFSGLSGYLAIKYLLKFVEKVGYKIFFWYRFLLAAVIVGVYFF